jgi:hypothetical protein
MKKHAIRAVATTLRLLVLVEQHRVVLSRTTCSVAPRLSAEQLPQSIGSVGSRPTSNTYTDWNVTRSMRAVRVNVLRRQCHRAANNNTNAVSAARSKLQYTHTNRVTIVRRRQSRQKQECQVQHLATWWGSGGGLPTLQGT